MFSLGDCRGTVVEALRFTGVGQLGTAGRGAVWLSPQNGTGPRDCKILNNWFEGLGSCGLVLGFATGCVVSGNHIDGTAEHGIYVSSSHNCIVANNVVRNAGRLGGVSTVVGIKVARTNGLTLSANVVEAPLTEGILIESGSSHCTIVGNLIRGAGQRAIRVNDKTSNVQVSGNILAEAATEAVRIFGGTGCNITGNTIESTNDTAIAIDGPARGVVVSNNSITAGPADGWTIRVDGSGHVLMGNVIGSCRYGIQLTSGARDVRLMFNQISATGRPFSEFDSKLVRVVD
jgi:parallel beta-helix repeat protein